MSSPRSSSLRLAAAVAVLATLVSPATMFVDAQARVGNGVCEMRGDSSACPFEDLTPSELDGSTLVYPGGATRCAFDDFTNALVPFETNSTYFFQVFPNSEGDRGKLVLFFEGGGACLDDVTCSFALQCMAETFTPNALNMSEGIANRSDPTNMFNDWNLVHLPYCTGDLHVGNHTAKLADNALLAAFNAPQCLGHNMTIHQVGYVNTMAVLDWAHANFPTPSELVISGDSAGALSAQVLSKVVAEKWQVEANNIKYSVLSDSYVGVLPESDSAGRIIDYYGGCDLDLGLSPSLVDACRSGNLSTETLVGFMIESLPTANWLFLDSKGDYWQRYYYALAEEGIQGYPFDDLMSQDDFYVQMKAILDAYKAMSNKVSTFYAAGDQHVFLKTNDFYHNATNVSTGEYLGSAINRWLEAEESIDGTSASDTGDSKAGSVNGDADANSPVACGH